MEDKIAQRKKEHLDIACNADVTFHKTGTLLDGVTLIHNALPDLAFEDIDTSLDLFGKRLRLPLVVAGMTGGSKDSKRINESLARASERVGCAFGLGSQRAMLQDPARTSTYQVREAAPHLLVFGNIGVIQARDLSTEELAEMVRSVGADALCVHLNPAQEIVQPEGDRDFRNGLEALARLARELPIPVIAKETGCGISYDTAVRLRRVGVEHVDVSGAGGTSWVAVEMNRTDDASRALGALFREWGVPTAACVLGCAKAGMSTVIATGGIETGVDVAKAIVLGATIGGMARPVLQELMNRGEEATVNLLERIGVELRTTMMLVGARNLEQLRCARRLLSPALQQWAPPNDLAEQTR